MKTFRVILLVILMMAAVQQAWAHPMGNFSINTYSLLTVNHDSLDVRYIVDRAEMPAFQNGENIDVNEDGVFDNDEIGAYADVAIPTLTEQLQIEQDGQPLLFTITDWAITFPEGQSELLTEKIIIDMTAPLFDDHGEITFADGNFAGRIGWREIVVNAADGIVVTGAIRANDLSAQLTDFPDDLVSPPEDMSAQFTFELSDEIGGVVETADMSLEKHDHVHGDDHHHTHETASFSAWWIVIGIAIVGAVLVLFRQAVGGGRIVSVE